MKRLELTQGESTLVDDDTYELLSKFKWHVHVDKNGYKSAFIRLSLSRVLMGDIPDKMQVDHINGDSLDNRRENLRIVTKKENAHNSKRNRAGGLPGVDFSKGHWRARCNRKFLGYFDDKYEAYNVYVNKYLEVNDV